MISQAGTLLSWACSLALPISFPMCPCLVWPFRSLSSLFEGSRWDYRWQQRRCPSLSDRHHHQAKRKTPFGTLGGIVGIGFIIGPGVGGYLASGSYGYLGMVIGATCPSTVTLLEHCIRSGRSPPARKPPPTDTSIHPKLCASFIESSVSTQPQSLSTSSPSERYSTS